MPRFLPGIPLYAVSILVAWYLVVMGISHTVGALAGPKQDILSIWLLVSPHWPPWAAPSSHCTFLAPVQYRHPSPVSSPVAARTATPVRQTIRRKS